MLNHPINIALLRSYVLNGISKRVLKEQRRNVRREKIATTGPEGRRKLAGGKATGTFARIKPTRPERALDETSIRLPSGARRIFDGIVSGGCASLHHRLISFAPSERSMKV